MYIEDDDLDKDITIEEVKTILANVKLNKAPGEDRISYEFFINAPNIFLEELTKTYNHILSSGEIDESFVKTVIFPIFKKGNPSLPSNYRGISFMNSIAKIMMGIINTRITDWIEKHKLMNEYQAGFRKKYSTMDNIFSLASIVNLKFQEEKKPMPFLSISKLLLIRFQGNLLFINCEILGFHLK